MRIAFRADASAAIGSGHVMRCLSLARELAPMGAACGFVCGDLPGHLGGVVAPAFPCTLLQPDGTGAEAVGAVTGAVDWLVVDHYGLDAGFESAARSFARRIMVIDDLADRPHDCDLLLDSGAYPDAAKRYERLVPARAGLLLGLHWAVLRREFVDARRRLDRRFDAVRRILVTFGANDPVDMSSRAARLLRQPKYAGLEVEFLGGISNPRIADVARLVEGVAHIRFRTHSDDMAALMSSADLAIGAAGTTAWERCALGLPSLALALAPNQFGIGPLLEQLGVARFLGYAPEVPDDVLEAELDRCLEDGAWRAAAAARGMAAVDGEGAGRAARRMMELTNG